MTTRSFPEDHPVSVLFRQLTDRALTQTSLIDRDLLLYLSNLLTEFIFVDNLYRLTDDEGRRLEYLVDMFEKAAALPDSEKKECYRHIGDYTLFILGMFPESIEYGKRSIPLSYYADSGRQSYQAASTLARSGSKTIVFRKLSDQYDGCVASLNWVKQYTQDPFYQYMLRQYAIT